MLLIASIMSCVAIAQDENYGIGDGFDPANPGNPGSNGWNASTGEVIIDDFTTGSLSNSITKIIGNSGSAAVTQIVVAGVINNTDFRVGNNYAKCTLVDFSRTAGISSVPSSAYSGNTHLCSIMLPTSITDIGSNAFNGCSALTAITSYTLTPPKVGSNALNGVADNMIVYVPSEAVDRYQEADIWKNFTILPIQETVHSLMVNMPSDIDLGAFKNMTLELVNAKSGQSYRYIITDKTSYVFNNLIENTVYKAYVKNNLNNIFGETSEVSINDKDAEVTFSSLSIPQSVNLSIIAGGNDITSQATVTWTDSIGNYLSQGPSLTGYAIGKKLNYSIALPQNIVMEYALPNTMQYVVADGGNNIVCTLTPLQKVVITGKVLDLSTKSAISGAVVSASQTFGGKYSKTTNVKTDSKGQYSIEIFRVPTSLAIAASDYISQTMECDVINAEEENISVADVSLKSISGAVISIDFTYKKCPDKAGEEGEVESFYSDYNNVDYTIFNKTQNRSIGQFNVQYPQIVLLEEVNENDVLELTASSRTSAFVPVKATTTIDAEQRASATFNIVGLGKLKSTFEVNGNASVVGSLYDAKGKLIKTYDYSGSSLTISDLADGNYTLVTMGSSKLFNTIYDLNQLPQTGLTMGADYAQNSVKVESGKLSVISIAEVPTLDESKLYYTGENTSFTVNKPSIVAGNYLTLTGHLDFKSAYSTKVSNVNLIVDLPESCSFVENSVMVGNSTSSYTLEGNRIIIPMARYTDRVRFCIIPTLGGDYAPSALAQFDIEGETITQPIGSAYYTAEDLSIKVPSTVATTTIPVSGTAIGACDIDIYDNDVLVGQTRSLANGTWATTVELNNPYNLSVHSICAKVSTKSGLELISKNLDCTYDMNAIQVSKVTMYHWNPEMNKTYESVFDFLNPKATATQWTVYYPRKRFTYTIEFTANDPERISNVVLYVHTADGKFVPVNASFNEEKGMWYAEIDMGNHNDGYYPVNCSVDFDCTVSAVSDRKQLDEVLQAINEGRDYIESVLSLINDLEIENDTINLEWKENDSLVTDIIVNIESQPNDNIDYSTLKNLYDALQWEYSESNFVVDDSVDDSQEFIDSLISDVNETISVSIDLNASEKVFQNNILESDNLINEIDEHSAIADKSLDNYNERQFVISTVMGEFNYSEVKATEIDKSDWIDDNITEISLTDGSKLIIYIDDNITIVDEYSNKAWTLIKSAEESLSTKAQKRISGEDIVRQLHEAFNALNSAKAIITNMIGDWTNAVKNDISRLTSQKDIIESKYLDELAESAATQAKIEKLERQLLEMGKQVKNGTSANYMGEVVDFNEKIEQLKLKRSQLLRKAQLHSNHISRYKGQINSFNSKLAIKTALLSQIMDYWEIVTGIVRLIDIIQYGIRDMSAWSSMIGYILPCSDDEIAAIQIKHDAENYKAKWGRGYLGAGSLSLVSTGLTGYLSFNTAAQFVMKTIGSLIADFIKNTAIQIYNETKSNSNRTFNEIKNRRAKLKCKRNCGDSGMPPCPDPPGNGNNGGGNGGSGGSANGGGGSNGSGCSNDNVRIDPSGYVYEGVFSNRLEGVTATCYYKETVEDMYGDKHENIVKWDAAEYAQENPLFTDENGYYRWDVPQGLWQVKFEKEGYETTYSEWLPVPPPQLDINIAMKQNVQPNVKTARAFEDAVEMEFDKYMMPELLTSDNIRVMAGETAVEGTVELLNEEISYEGNEEKFASKVRFNAAAPFDATEVTLMVSNRVKSYAGIRMQDDFSQTFTIEPEVQKIVCDAEASIEYGGQGELTVQVLPAVASAGKTLKVKSSSAMILSTDVKELTLDNEGKASLTVSGELPGAAAITYSVDGYDLAATTLVNVELSTIGSNNPSASIASGSAVLKGTAVTLSCPAKDAVIYYTTDGSCPCGSEAKQYDGTPITIVNPTTLKIMSVGKDGAESDIVEYTYTIRQTNLQIPLAKGWNWASHNRYDDMNGEELMLSDIERVLTQNSEIYRDPQIGFTGHLDKISANDAFKVKTSAAASIALSGDMFNAANFPVTLKKGWNWLGCPLYKSMALNDALSLMEPEEGDYIVNIEGGFSQYDGTQWTGTLSTLNPGQGYLFKSASDKELTYNTSPSAASAAYEKTGEATPLCLVLI